MDEKWMESKRPLKPPNQWHSFSLDVPEIQESELGSPLGADYWLYIFPGQSPLLCILKEDDNGMNNDKLGISKITYL